VWDVLETPSKAAETNSRLKGLIVLAVELLVASAKRLEPGGALCLSEPIRVEQILALSYEFPR
jgi:hypothetical protein